MPESNESNRDASDAQRVADFCDSLRRAIDHGEPISFGGRVFSRRELRPVLAALYVCSPREGI